MLNYSEDPDKLYHIQAGPGDVGRYVILPGDPKRVPRIAKYLVDAVQVADSREFLTYTGTLSGEKVSVTSTGIGGPSAAIAMEELVMCGADTFIRVGTCGGMAMDVLGGDLVIADGAIRMDGTSREYAPLEFPAVPDFNVTCALARSASSAGKRYHIGVVQSKDSFYGESSPETKPVGYELLQKWDSWLKLGCLASEMESAALFTVARSLGVRAGAILLAMDNAQREAAGLENPIVHDTDNLIRVAIEALRILIRADREGKEVFT